MIDLAVLIVITQVCSSSPILTCREDMIKCLETKSVEDNKAFTDCYTSLEVNK